MTAELLNMRRPCSVRVGLVVVLLVVAACARLVDAATIHDAAREGDTTTVAKMLDQQDVNVRDEQGRTPLHHAVEGHHQEMVELLVESGADLVAQNDHGETPLDHAEDPMIRKYLMFKLRHQPSGDL